VQIKAEKLKREMFERIGQLLGRQGSNINKQNEKKSIDEVLKKWSKVSRYSETRTLASEINNIVAEITIKYLGSLIKHLIKAGTVIGTDYNSTEDNLNLITLGINDLMRAKLQCN